MSDTGQEIIRPLLPIDSLEELTEPLHRAYAPLAAMGFRYYATHQTVEQTGKRIATGSCLVAKLDGKLVGTVTWYCGETKYCGETNSKYPELYRRSDVAHLEQFAVEPSLQRQGLGLR